MKWYSRVELQRILSRNGHRASTESELPDSEQWVCEYCLATVAQRKQTTATESPYSGYVNELWRETPVGHEKCEGIDDALANTQ